MTRRRGIGLVIPVLAVAQLGACAAEPQGSLEPGLRITSDEDDILTRNVSAGERGKAQDRAQNGPPQSGAQLDEGTDDAQASKAEIPLAPFEDILVFRESRRIEIRAWTCLKAGYLEQIACSPGTREHESLVVVRARPSNIHAALLLAAFEPGAPGRWTFDPETETVSLDPPRGDEVGVWFRYENEDGEPTLKPAHRWIRDHTGEHGFPDQPWIFGGSMFRENPEFMGPGEHYVADMTGSIVGLVTFGDEVLGSRKVISDQAAIHEPEWIVNTEIVPPEGTEVRLVFVPYGKTPPLEIPAQNKGDSLDEGATDGEGPGVVPPGVK